MPNESSACQWGSSNQGSLSGNGNGGFTGSGSGDLNDGGEETDTDGDGIPNIPDPSFPATLLGREPQDDCLPGNLVECFYNRGIMPEGDYTISIWEYLSLLRAISYDVDNQGSIINYRLREAYDTPFYNGGGSGGSTVALKGTICISGLICSGRSEMNYIGQGIWSASAMESQITSQVVTNGWKVIRYGRLASIDTNIHNNIGYYSYMVKHPVKFLVTSLGINNGFSFPVSVVSKVIGR